MTRTTCCVLALMATISCTQAPAAVAPPQQLPPGEAGLTSWRESWRRLELLRDLLVPRHPYTMKIGMKVSHPGLPAPVFARGVLAAAPPRALRLVLLGPGGTTALDLWMCGDAFRFAVPATDLVKRGDAASPREELRGLPIDFLRWWLLRPLDGELLYHARGWRGATRDEPPRRDQAAQRLVLRDGAAVIDLTVIGDGDLRALHRLHGERQWVETDARSCGEVRYGQAASGLSVHVRCEELSDAAPPPRAFADPDDPAQACLGAAR